MEKIAIPTDGEQVAQHFGRCPEYTLVEIADQEVVNKEIVDNPGHKPGYLPRYLNELGVDCVLAGGMGRKAVDIFADNGIKTIIGVNGKIEDVIADYIADDLSSEGEVCDHHHHGEHNC